MVYLALSISLIGFPYIYPCIRVYLYFASITKKCFSHFSAFYVSCPFDHFNLIFRCFLVNYFFCCFLRNTLHNLSSETSLLRLQLLLTWLAVNCGLPTLSHFLSCHLSNISYPLFFALKTFPVLAKRLLGGLNCFWKFLASGLSIVESSFLQNLSHYFYFCRTISHY